MAVKVVRASSGVTVSRGSAGPAGPTGADALTSVVLGFVGGYSALEELPGVPITSTCPISAAGSIAITRTPAYDTVVFKIMNNGTEIGTVTYAPESAVGVIALTVSELVRGDYVYLEAPTVVDLSLTHVAVTLSQGS